VLVHTNGAILIDSILGGTGLPTPSLEGIGIVRMNLYHMGTVEQDTNRSTRQDFSVGIVSDLSAILIPLTTNHRDRFRVSHLAPKEKGEINEEKSTSTNQKSNNRKIHHESEVVNTFGIL
jgi:hypothetical protein